HGDLALAVGKRDGRTILVLEREPRHGVADREALLLVRAGEGDDADQQGQHRQSWNQFPHTSLLREKVCVFNVSPPAPSRRRAEWSSSARRAGRPGECTLARMQTSGP